MYSFYGGKQGNSFILSQRFDSIAKMNESFSLGGAYKAVNYGEYVIIDTVSKNNPDNGKIYRRNIDGAEYIGQVVGPSGNAPGVEIVNFSSLASEVVPSEGGSGTGEGTVEMHTDDRQDIDFKYVFLRSADYKNSLVKIGFKFPKLKVSASLKSSDAYATPAIKEKAATANMPFKYDFEFTIPKGKHGLDISNLSIREVENKKKLVYDATSYESRAAGDTSAVVVGDYNMIEGVDLSDNGTLTVTCSNNVDTFEKVVKWITGVTLNAETGQFDMTFNNDTINNLSVGLQWVNSIALADDGTVSVGYTNRTAKTRLPNKIKWVTSTTMGADGQITVNYNDGTNSRVANKVKWIKSINMSDNGVLSVTYNDGLAATTIKNNIKWVKETRINGANYNLEVKYNTSDSWVSLGPVKAYNGILVGKSFDLESNPTMNTQMGAINKLNQLYPNGLVDLDNQGKLVAVGPEFGTKVLYGFNYEEGNKSWFYLGSVGTGSTYTFFGSEGSDTEALNNLAENGAWFVLED